MGQVSFFIVPAMQCPFEIRRSAFVGRRLIAEELVKMENSLKFTAVVVVNAQRMYGVTPL
jgi:hypothetical protein